MNFNNFSDEDEDDAFCKRAVLPVASFTGARDFNPDAWGDCSAKEFLRNVILEAEKYPSIIMSKVNRSKDNDASNNSNDNQQSSVMYFPSGNDEKFFKCPEKFRLSKLETDEILADYSSITSKMHTNSVVKPNLKYSKDKWRKIFQTSKTLPDKNSINELDQPEIIKMLEILYKILIENLLNDEAFGSECLFWIWTCLHLLSVHQTKDTYSLLRNISRSISERRKDILSDIENGSFNYDHVNFVSNFNRIIFIISNIFHQSDLSDY